MCSPWNHRNFEQSVSSGGMGLSRHFGVWNVILHDRCRTSETFSSVWQAWYFLERWFRRSFVNLDVRFRTHDDLRGRRGASDALGPFVVAVETSTKKCPKPGVKHHFHIFKVQLFVMCAILIEHLTYAHATLSSLCACQIALAVARCSVLRSHAAYYRSLLVALKLCECQIALAVAVLIFEIAGATLS